MVSEPKDRNSMPRRWNMTQPTTPARAPFANAAPTQPPKMPDEQIRLECAKLAVQAHVQPSLLIETANKIYSFVKSGTM
jgi:hypothetical protein